MAKLKIVKEQNISEDCIVCGDKNLLGLNCRFFELEDNSVAGIVTPTKDHQSYPGRVHGGIEAALLDETIGRVLMALDPDGWAVTAEMNVKFKKPCPYDTQLIIHGRTTEHNRRIFKGEGEIYLPSGEVCATATATYFKMSLEKIGAGDVETLGWRPATIPSDLTEIEIPSV